jgi:hypothetical protein
LTQGGGAQPVNVSSITQLVWFEERWFAATNYGVFYTPVDSGIQALRGNTEENIKYFYASELVFAYLPMTGNYSVSNMALPPCTFLRKVRNKKRS